MELHKNWGVSENGLKKLQELSDNELRETIKAKKLFTGLPTEHAEKQIKAIYGKINAGRTKKETGEADTPKGKKGNRKDNKK